MFYFSLGQFLCAFLPKKKRQHHQAPWDVVEEMLRFALVSGSEATRQRLGVTHLTLEEDAASDHNQRKGWRGMMFFQTVEVNRCKPWGINSQNKMEIHAMPGKLREGGPGMEIQPCSQSSTFNHELSRFWEYADGKKYRKPNLIQRLCLSHTYGESLKWTEVILWVMMDVSMYHSWNEIPYLAFCLPLCYAGKSWACYPSFQNHTSLTDKRSFWKELWSRRNIGRLFELCFWFWRDGFSKRTPTYPCFAYPRPPQSPKMNPNERNSFLNCWVWGMFQGYVGKFLEIWKVWDVDFLLKLCYEETNFQQSHSHMSTRY